MKKLDINKYFKVHCSIKGRRRFKCKQFIALFLFLVCIGTDAFLFYAQKSNSDNKLKSTLFVLLGIILLILTLATYLLFNIVQTKLFYKSQELFFQTKEFNNLKTKALTDVNKVNKQKLKEYYQLHLIDKKTMQDYLAKIKKH